MTTVREQVNDLIADTLTQDEWKQMGIRRGWLEPLAVENEEQTEIGKQSE